MNQELKLFSYQDFKVRVEIINNEPWFVAKDVCDILQHTNSRKAITDLCHQEDVTNSYIGVKTGKKSNGSDAVQNINVNLINESGLYALIFGSRLESAKKFKKWVTSEVLPSIRKTGTYSVHKTIEERSLELISDLSTLVQAQKEKIESDAPKVVFYDAVTKSGQAIDLGEAAKILNLGMGRNVLIDFLKKKKVLMGNGQPYQLYVDRRFFALREERFEKPGGLTGIYLKTVVFQAGLEFILKLVRQTVADGDVQLFESKKPQDKPKEEILEMW